jgi:hypothetical protein
MYRILGRHAWLASRSVYSIFSQLDSDRSRNLAISASWGAVAGYHRAQGTLVGPTTRCVRARHANCNSGDFRGGCLETHQQTPRSRFPQGDAILTWSASKYFAASRQPSMTKFRTEINLFQVGKEVVLAHSLLNKMSLYLSFETRRLCSTAITISGRTGRSTLVTTVIVSREAFKENQYRIDHRCPNVWFHHRSNKSKRQSILLEGISGNSWGMEPRDV